MCVFFSLLLAAPEHSYPHPGEIRGQTRGALRRKGGGNGAYAGVEGCPGIAADEELHMSLTLVKICEVQQVTVGVVKKTLTEGGGYEKPNDGSKVSLRYTAMLQDGTVFDRTDDDELAQFTVDEGMYARYDSTIRRSLSRVLLTRRDCLLQRRSLPGWRRRW
jgi:hypothetical protein